MSLREKIGKDDARTLVKSIEATIFENIGSKWTTTKYELIEEMEKRFATKTDLELLETRLSNEIKSEIKSVRSEMKLYFLVLLFVMLLTNPKAIDLLAKLLGIIK